MATLVPTPSVEAASTGRVIRVRRDASNRPAKPPRPPSTSGRRVRRIESFMSSTALSPASTSTPAPAYVMGSVTLTTLPRRWAPPRGRPLDLGLGRDVLRDDPRARHGPVAGHLGCR